MAWRAAACLVLLLATPAVGASLSPPAPAPPLENAVIPNLFDPRHRLPKPELGAIKSIRFLTTDDFPPFHFAMQDGTLAGFDIDLTRAICKDLGLTCTIQARRFETLVAQIKAGADDALIAAFANTPTTRIDLAFTAPYYTTPGRFVARRSARLVATPEGLTGHVVGVETGTAHEAYLRAFFTQATIKTYPDKAALRDSLKRGETDAMFGDAISSALWLNSVEGSGCCVFEGAPFTESHYFGNGVSIAVGKDNVALRRALDFELAKLSGDGTYADLYLKYFPIGFY